MKSSAIGTWLMLLVVIGCFGATRPPAELQSGESCSWCRMAVSDHRFATQLSAIEPLFFDDIGCMQHYLRTPKERGVPADAAPYVADHRTAEWIPAATAWYRRCPSVETPMGSHLLAYRDAESAKLDKVRGDCSAVTAAEIFGSSLPGGKK